MYQSFISLTADYRKIGTRRLSNSGKTKLPPALVLLISDNFDVQEAALFWNLRASGIYTAWSSFAQRE
jgi:hypothetical protein